MCRILLIDDDDAVRTVLRLTLHEFDHTVIEARDGIEGLASYPAEGVDLVITDIMMPRKGGIEVIKELRQRHPQLKIMAISAGGRSDSTDYLSIATLLGAAKVLAKPFSSHDFLTALSELLPPSGPTPV